MNQIQEFRHNRLLSKEFDIKEATPCPTLAAEIQPVVLVADLAHDDPFVGATNEYWCTGAIGLTAAGAQFSSIQLTNPVGSGTVGVIDVFAITGAAGDVGLSFSLTALPGALGPFAGQRLNRRGTVAGQSLVSQLSLTTLSAAGLSAFEQLIRASGTPVEYRLLSGLVIDEGGILTFQSQTAAVLLNVWLRWREFVKRPGQ